MSSMFQYNRAYIENRIGMLEFIKRLVYFAHAKGPTPNGQYVYGL